jgi:hypothetical protein
VWFFDSCGDLRLLQEDFGLQLILICDFSLISWVVSIRWSYRENDSFVRAVLESAHEEHLGNRRFWFHRQSSS